MNPTDRPRSAAFLAWQARQLNMDLPAPSFPPHRLTVARNARDGFRYDADVLARVVTAPAGLVGR